ncbi:MAG TPA: SDR family NAD(P)-dependent oxidoreductase, partial [Candidatus Angelobacter sp.]
QALSQARRAAQNNGPAAAIGSIKANIGHTKAAAGVAALIKAAMAVQAKVIPPTTGCDRPHPELRADKPALRVMHQGELWPAEGNARAGVSAFGFGGINSHVTLESADNTARKGFTTFERQRLGAVQDCEVFLFQAASLPELAQQLDELVPLAGEISFSEMTDLAAHLAGRLNRDITGLRAACIASSPDELLRGVKSLQEWCVSGVERKIECSQGVFLNTRPARPRIGFLFPGQASPVYSNGGAWARRFAVVSDLYGRARLPHAQSVATETAQPCIVTASLAGLTVLESLGLKANVAVGHSLGDITALFWAGAYDEETLLRIVRERGRLMAELGTSSGSMASIHAASDDVRQRLNGDPLVVAADNSPRQTVISGEGFALRRFLARVHAEGLTTTLLPVSHAFHSPLMADAAAAFSQYLQAEAFQPLNLQKRVVSSVTATVLPEDTDFRELLTDQITLPVQFARAAALAAEEADLLIEVGPGAVLTGIMEELADKPAVALDAGGASLLGLLTAAGAAFVLGADIEGTALFGDRFHRPIDLRRRHKFLENPCEAVSGPSLPEAAIRKDPPAQAAPAVAPDNTNDVLDILRNLVAQRAELPLPAIEPQHRFLDDLHLNSITISQIILQAAARAGAAAPVTPAEFTNATLAEAAALLEQNRGKAPAHAEERHPAGAEPWIRTLGVEWVEQTMRAAGKRGPGNWQVLAMEDGSFRRALEEQFKSVPGNGVVCCLPREKNYSTAQYILDSVKSALQQKAGHVVLVQHGELAGALARSLFLENSHMKVTVVDTPARDTEAADLIAREALAATGFTEARYGADGTRREPRLTVLWPEDHAGSAALTTADVVLVSGGGKGIAAECALALARSYGCRLALVGRSDPARDDELAANLARFRNAGVSFTYYAADLTKEEAAGNVVNRAQAELGTVTAILHGAGVNNPQRVEDTTASDLQATLASKTGALSNLLRRIDPSQLRLLLTFGSIIGRTGLHGEGDYGLANEWLRMMVEEWQVEHPACRCMNLEWSVWAGTGMGQRLGVLDSLQRQGITPLPLEEALRTLPKLLEWKSAPTSFVVTGRTGNLPTLRFQHSEPPLLRFLENVRLHYPGVELIVEAGLNTDTDPYLAEHVFQGQQLVPAVMGMEAMAQAACALEQTDQRPSFRNLRFISPIVVPSGQTVVVRIAAVRRRPGVVAAVVRCSSTAFQVEHFTGECVFGRALENDVPSPAPERDAKPLAVDSARDLYGRILFHHGRFRRIENYQHLDATHSVARLASPAGQPWFARYFPGELLLGDAASRDAALHSVQACIPHKTVLPTGV